MKIALIIFRADPARGGAETYTADIAAGLARRGHDVSLLSSEFGPAIPGVKFVRINAKSPTRLGRYKKFLDGLDSHLAENKYDIVHSMLPVRSCDVYHPHAGLAIESIRAGHLKHAGAVKRVFSKLGTQLNRKRARFAAVERKLLEGPNPPVVLCLSDYVKGTVVEHYPSLRPRLQTLFNAVDLNRFDPSKNADAGKEIRTRFGIAENEIVGLMIAQDFQRKGLARAIQAIAQLKSPPKLLVVGKPNPAKFIALARQLKIESQIIFAGPTKSPDDFYRAADFFILPTSHDPCSLVVLESLAMGVPVISTIFNGACEIMESGKHGIVLKEPEDIPALAQAIRQMLDRPLRENMRHACLELRSLLSFEKHLHRLDEIYANRPSDTKADIKGSG